MMNNTMIKTPLLTLFFLSPALLAAQPDCLPDEQTHFEADLPADSYEWFFSVLDNEHVQASLLFPAEIDGAVFFQVFAQKEDATRFEYAFPLEALDHPLTAEAKEVEFIISNAQLADLVIHIQYLEPGYRECTGDRSYSYYVKSP